VKLIDTSIRSAPIGGALVHHPAPYRIGVVLAAVAAVGAGATAFWPDVLHGPAVMQGSARGTSLVMLLVAVPTLLLAMRSTRRGSARATFAWLGALGYLAYNSVLLLFGTPFNALFLLYVAGLGLSIAGLVSLLSTVQVLRLAARAAAVPAHGIAAYLGVIALGNLLIWLKVVVPALGEGEHPGFLDGTGLVTNPIYVQDLAFWLPVAALAASWLWQHRPWGRVLAGGQLCMWLIEAVGVTADQWWGSSADPSSTVATMGGAYLFAVMTVIGAGALAVFLRRVH